MSIKIMTQVWTLQLHSTQKLVLLALADNANDSGACWPSIEAIMEKSSLSERAVQSNLRELEALGHLTRQLGGGRGQTTRYIIHPNPAAETPYEKPRIENGVFGAQNPAANDVKPRTTCTRNHKEPSRTVITTSGKPDIVLFGDWQFQDPPPPGKEAQYLLAFLNKVTGRRYRGVPANLNPIKVRLKEASVDEVKKVIAHKANEWSGTDMEKYLRPETLFRASKFASYLGEAA